MIIIIVDITSSSWYVIHIHPWSSTTTNGGCVLSIFFKKWGICLETDWNHGLENPKWITGGLPFTNRTWWNLKRVTTHKDRFWGILPIWDNVQLMSPANQLTNWSRGLLWGRFTFISKFIKCYGSCPSPPKQPNINWQMLNPHPVAHMFFIYYGKWSSFAHVCSSLSTSQLKKNKHHRFFLLHRYLQSRSRRPKLPSFQTIAVCGVTGQVLLD